MKFGLFMMPLHPPTRSFADSYDRDIELLVLADRLGYTEAWIGEHITETWETAPVPELLISKALALTESMILATGVTLLPLHHPVDTAHRIAMLDHMARGRFYWGIGTRSAPGDLELYGLHYEEADEVREQSREALEVILGLWAAKDGRFEYDGKYYSVHAPEYDHELQLGLYYKPYQLPHPPIGVASATPGSESLATAGERGWLPISGANLLTDALHGHWQAVERGAARSGKSPDRGEWRVCRDIYVGETPESARAEARVVLGRPYDEHQWINQKVRKALDRMKIDPSMRDEDVNVDYLMENMWIVGDPQECADKIRKLHEDLGGFGTLLVVTQDPDDHSLAQRSQRLLAEEVGPLVHDLT